MRPVASGVGRAQLKPDVRRDAAFVAQSPEHLVGCDGGAVVARVEDDATRVDARLDADALDMTMHGAVALSDRERWNARVDLQRLVLLEHPLLEDDPLYALAGLPVGHPPQIGPHLAAQIAEHILAAGVWQAPHEVQQVVGVVHLDTCELWHCVVVG